MPEWPREMRIVCARTEQFDINLLSISVGRLPFDKGRHKPSVREENVNVKFAGKNPGRTRVVVAGLGAVALVTGAVAALGVFGSDARSEQQAAGVPAAVAVESLVDEVARPGTPAGEVADPGAPQAAKNNAADPADPADAAPPAAAKGRKPAAEAAGAKGRKISAATDGNLKSVTASGMLVGHLIKGAGSNRCIDVTGKSSADGTRLQIWDCTGGEWQFWDFQADGTIRTQGMCMDVAWGSKTNGAAVQIASCNGGAAQKFTLNAAGDLVNKQSGKCVDVVDKKTVNGAKLQQWDCGGTTNQKWAKA